MSGPLPDEILEAITRFTDRLHWFMPFGPTEEELPVETVQAILAEWELLEPHLGRLEAMGHKEELAPLRVAAESMRARVRVAFLVELLKLLQVIELYLHNEMMLRLPPLVKRLSAKDDLSAEMAETVKVLMAQMSELPEPEVFFRKAMETADLCEPHMTQLHQNLQKNWPDHWTDEMQRRLENRNQEDHEKWLEEVEQELNALCQRYFSQQDCGGEGVDLGR